MSTTILPSWCTTQARGRVEIDYSLPLAKDLIAAYNLTTFRSRTVKDSTNFGIYDGRRSSIGKFPYTLHGYLTSGASEVPVKYYYDGQCFDFNGTNTTRAYTVGFTGTTLSQVRTYIIKVYLRDTTTRQFILGHFNSALTPVHLYGSGIYIESGTLYGVGASNNSKIITSTAPTTNEWLTIALVTGVTNGKMYVNGNLVASGDLNSAGVGYNFAIGLAGQQAADVGGGSGFFDGMVGATLVYARELSESEIKQLTVNPYQLVRRKRNIWADAVAGLSGVSNDTTIRYALLNSALQDVIVRYNTVMTVQQDSTYSWDTFTSSTADKPIEWDVISSAFKDNQLRWDTTTSVVTDRNIEYSILSSATKDTTVDWNILQSITKESSLSWNILSNLLTAYSDLSARYSIIGSIFKDIITGWDINSNVTTDVSTRYSILTSTVEDKTLKWAISEAITQDLIVSSNILNEIAKDVSIRWDSAGAVGNDLVIRYSILTDISTIPPIERTIIIRKQGRNVSVKHQSRTINF